MLTINDAYEITVNRMCEIDKKVAELRGKRDAYDEMRACLYEIIQQCKKEDEGE